MSAVLTGYLLSCVRSFEEVSAVPYLGVWRDAYCSVYGPFERYLLFCIWAFGEASAILCLGFWRGSCCSVFGPLERHLLFCVWAFGEASAVLCLGLWRGTYILHRVFELRGVVYCSMSLTLGVVRSVLCLKL